MRVGWGKGPYRNWEGQSCPLCTWGKKWAENLDKEQKEESGRREEQVVRGDDWQGEEEEEGRWCGRKWAGKIGGDPNGET